MPEYPNGTQIITCFEKIIRFKKPPLMKNLLLEITCMKKSQVPFSQMPLFFCVPYRVCLNTLSELQK